MEACHTSLSSALEGHAACAGPTLNRRAEFARWQSTAVGSATAATAGRCRGLARAARATQGDGLTWRTRFRKASWPGRRAAAHAFVLRERKRGRRRACHPSASRALRRLGPTEIASRLCWRLSHRCVISSRRTGEACSMRWSLGLQLRHFWRVPPCACFQSVFVLPVPVRIVCRAQRDTEAERAFSTMEGASFFRVAH